MFKEILMGMNFQLKRICKVKRDNRKTIIDTALSKINYNSLKSLY